jgi:4-amino-4-deoxychorismate lyase
MEMITADEGYWFGIGAFETLFLHRGTPVFLEEHLERLAEACIVLDLLSREEKEAWIRSCKKEVLEEQKAGPAGDSVLKIAVSEKNFCMTRREYPYREEQFRRGFRLCRAEARRNETSFLTRLKTLNCADNILARRAAAKAGYDEAVFLNSRGEICEGSSTNIFFAAEGEIVTPPLSCGLLDGILRQYVMRIRPVRERVVTPEMVPEFQEIFVTNSLLGIMPVREFDGRVFTRRTEAESIRKEYAEYLSEGRIRGQKRSDASLHRPESLCYNRG